MAILASKSALALSSRPPASSTLLIKRPPSALDSSDAAETDTSTSPSMNPERSPSATSSDASLKERDGGASAPSSTARRRKTTVADPSAMDEDKIAPSPSGSKPQRKYERKTKRFIWPDELHRLFVAAIFDVGLKNASPKALLALMEAAGPNSGLTTEHLKSHLQKYRLNYERSRLEFLEFYDRSAKRNLKRRRRHAQHRAGGGAGEANTMFVFPISNSKRHKGRDSDSDSDDSDSDRERGDGNDNNDTSMEVDVRRGRNPTHPTPQGHSGTFAAAEAQARSLGFSQLVQSAQSNNAAYDASGNGRQPPQLSNDRLLTVATSVGMPAAAAQHFPPDYAAASETQRTSSTDRDRELAAAAVAVAAYRYPLGQLPMAGAVGGAPGSGGMPELTDPQWNILNSLMSPPLAGMSGLGGEGAIFAHTPQVSTVPVTSEAMGRGGSDTFMLQEEPSDLQMQMHLAMQAQMNLHRQMLTRKVEVSQHLARHSSLGNMDVGRTSNSSTTNIAPSAGVGGFSESWRNVQQLQQQQQYHRQQQQQHYQEQQMNILTRPSLDQPVVGAHTSLLATATSAPPAPALTEAAHAAPSSASEQVVASTASSERPTAGAAGTEEGAGMATESKSDDDSLDLYRWDRIDLNVELEDDDLFGFLKS